MIPFFYNYDALKQLFYILLCIISFGSLNAHPSWGIVVDAKGNIYYVDVFHNFGTLWKIDSGLTQLTKLTSEEFHAHSLNIDSNDHLWTGLDIWIEGVIEGEGHQYLIRYLPEKSQFDTLLFSDKYAQFSGGNITWDENSQGIYYLPGNSMIASRPLQGEPCFPFLNKFQRVNTMNFGPDESLWITDNRSDNGSIFRWNEQDGLSLYASGLLPEDPTDPAYPEKRFQLFYGFTFSADGNPVISDAATRSVAEILPDGTRRLLYKSRQKHQYPVGVYFRNGNYYIMEVGYQSGEGHSGPNVIVLNEKQQTGQYLQINYSREKVRSIPFRIK